MNLLDKEKISEKLKNTANQNNIFINSYCVLQKQRFLQENNLKPFLIMWIHWIHNILDPWIRIQGIQVAKCQPEKILFSSAVYF